MTLLGSPPLADRVGAVFIVGGASAYAEALASHRCERVHLTRVLAPPFETDARIPAIDASRFVLEAAPERGSEGGVEFEYCVYVRARSAVPRPLAVAAGVHEELQ